MAAIPSSAPIVSVLPGLPSAASIVPNRHLHGVAVVPLSNTHQVCRTSKIRAASAGDFSLSFCFDLIRWSRHLVFN
jgi:hypothetical protein